MTWLCRPVHRSNWTHWSNSSWLSHRFNSTALVHELKFTSCQTFSARQSLDVWLGSFYMTVTFLNSTQLRRSFVLIQKPFIRSGSIYARVTHTVLFFSPRKSFVSINFRMLLESNFCYLLRVGDPSHSAGIILTKAQSLLTAESWRDWLAANLKEDEKILLNWCSFSSQIDFARRKVFNGARQENDVGPCEVASRAEESSIFARWQLAEKKHLEKKINVSGKIVLKKLRDSSAALEPKSWSSTFDADLTRNIQQLYDRNFFF